jgi:hypothetical protein
MNLLRTAFHGPRSPKPLHTCTKVIQSRTGGSLWSTLVHLGPHWSAFQPRRNKIMRYVTTLHRFSMECGTPTFTPIACPESLPRIGFGRVSGAYRGRGRGRFAVQPRTVNHEPFPQTTRLVPQESMRTSFGGPRFCAAMPSVNPRLTFTASGRAIDAEPLMIYRDAQLEDRSLPARPCRRGWQARTTRKTIPIPWSRPGTT